MTCKNCGKEFEGGTFCPHCGASQVSANNTTRADDAPSTGYAVLGFFFPLIGLILLENNFSKQTRNTILLILV